MVKAMSVWPKPKKPWAINNLLESENRQLLLQDDARNGYGDGFVVLRISGGGLGELTHGLS